MDSTVLTAIGVAEATAGGAANAAKTRQPLNQTSMAPLQGLCALSRRASARPRAALSLERPRGGSHPRAGAQAPLRGPRSTPNLLALSGGPASLLPICGGRGTGRAGLTVQDWGALAPLQSLPLAQCH